MTLSWLISTGLTNAVLATVLALVALVVSRLVRSPVLTHLLWIVVLLKLLTPPIIQVPVGFRLTLLPDYATHVAAITDSTDELPTDQSMPAIAAPTDGSKADAANVSSIPRSQANRRIASSGNRDLPASGPRSGRRPLAATLVSYVRFAITWLPIIWLAGATAMLVLTVYRAWRFLWFVRSEGDSDAALASRLAVLAQKTCLASAPQLVVIDDTISPLLWGISAWTKLIFPTRLARDLSPLQCDALLLHELAHYSRGDQWVRLLEMIAQVVFWWHPVVWLAGKEIEAAEEQCCDAWVIQHRCANRRIYADALLAALDFLSDQPALLPPAASGLGDVPLLRLRLMQIMRGEIAAKLSPGVKFPVLVTALLLLPLGPGFSAASATSSPSSIAMQQPQHAAPSPASDSFSTSETGAGHNEYQSAATANRLPEITAIRPITLITASAPSPNGKYRLERRKGDQVTLVHQTSNFRLSMTDHRIHCAGFTPDSRLFVTGHEDSQVRVWDSETGGLVSALKGNTAAVRSLDITARSGGGCLVAAGSQDGSVIVWNLASGEELAHLAPVSVSVGCIRWSHDGQQLAISYGDFSDDDQAALLIWSPQQNQVLRQVELPRPVAALAWLPDDESVLAADWTGEALLWRLGDESSAHQISLGVVGKQIAEAAHWSADCPLVPSGLTSQLLLGAD
jgi:beta-lactamase regulating signal transducer with metallopeptidase domain